MLDQYLKGYFALFLKFYYIFFEKSTFYLYPRNLMVRGDSAQIWFAQ